MARLETPPGPRSVSPALNEFSPSGAGKWMALTAALLGWMFDGFEMGVFSQVGRPAIQDLLSTTDEAKVGLWFNVVIACFLVGAATGGVIFGWLGDRIGRVRAMTLSVFTYAVFTGLCGLVGDIQIGSWVFPAAIQLGLLRFIASIGMGGEWSLGVALVMEVWPNRSRAFMAGLIGAAANVGYLAVGFVGIWLNAIIADLATLLTRIGLSDAAVSALTANQGWRIMMLIGTLPALLTFLIRVFVPESEKWEHERRLGKTSHWQAIDLLGVLVGCLGPFLIVYVWATNQSGSIPHSTGLRIVATLAGLVIATLGYTFPVVRYLQRLHGSPVGGESSRSPKVVLGRMMLAAALSGVALLGTWGSAQQAPSYAGRLIDTELAGKAAAQISQAAGTTEDESVQAKIAGTLIKAGDRERLARLLDEAEGDGEKLTRGLTQAIGDAVSSQSIARAAKALEDDARRTMLVTQLRTKVNAKEHTQIWLAVGAIVATITAALMGDWIGRRNAYFLLCALSLLSTWAFYIGNVHFNSMFLFSTFLIGGFTASFYGWLPLYLPELFPTNIRATGQGFGYNFGRILAAIGALQTGTLMGQFSQDVHLGPLTILRGHPAACSVIALIYLVGMAIIWLAPETRGKPLPE
jgi:SHS family sialic acid transporter-like MFS transporter